MGQINLPMCHCCGLRTCSRCTLIVHVHHALATCACQEFQGVVTSLWEQCLDKLEGELSPHQFNTWIRPLHAVKDGHSLRLLAPNPFVRDWVNENFAQRIEDVLRRVRESEVTNVVVQIGSVGDSSNQSCITATPSLQRPASTITGTTEQRPSNLQPEFTFDSFVEGRSNQLARAYSIQVAEEPGGDNNPLFVYGGVGLGKTHLMQALGNAILKKQPNSSVVYRHSERFVSDMVNALKRNLIDDFKQYYRSVNTLLIDDIQFFARKEHTQDEFFHTFNALLSYKSQIVLTCDRYPKDVAGLEERLASRFSCGLTVAIEPPDTETRTAILMLKAQETGIQMPDEVAFFISERIRSNVRELEGALRRVVANAQFTHRPITLNLTKEALRDVLALQEKLITIENIQQTVARYYKIRINDLLSKRKSLSIVRPRQIAMSLARELTNHSLPEIGDAFGGKDHTTVLHAHNKVRELRNNSVVINEEYSFLLRTLTT